MQIDKQPLTLGHKEHMASVLTGTLLEILLEQLENFLICECLPANHFQ